jgi:uncharacterized protein (DUF362 family)
MDRSLNLIGLGEKLDRDYSVLIKPNLVRTPSPSGWATRDGAYSLTLTPDGDITHRFCIEALLKILLEHGIRPENITVGEAPGGSEAEVVYGALGLHELCKGFGVNLLDLNNAPAMKVEILNGRMLQEVWLPKVALDVDFRINLATLKVHHLAVVSLCLKNWGIGLPPGKYYGMDKGSGCFREGLLGPLPIHGASLGPMGVEDRVFQEGQEVAASRVIVDVCGARGFDLGIIEGLTVVDYDNIQSGPKRTYRLRRNNIMLASLDMATVDAVGARILGFDPQKILHIRWAEKAGLGISDLERIEIVGEKIEDVEMRSNPRATQVHTMLPPL